MIMPMVVIVIVVMVMTVIMFMFMFAVVIVAPIMVGVVIVVVIVVVCEDLFQMLVEGSFRGPIDLPYRDFLLGRDLGAGLEFGGEDSFSPCRQPSLPCSWPHGVSITQDCRARLDRCISVRRIPNVAVSVKMIVSIRSKSAGRHSTHSNTPGRFFFI